MKRKFCLLVLALPFIFLSACANTATNPATPTPTSVATHMITPTPTSTPVSSPILGVYTSTITRKDIDSTDLTRNAAAGSDVQPGTWVLTFRSDGYYTAFGGIYPYGTSYIGAGPYILAQNQLTLVDGKCQEFYFDGRVGTYSWSLQGNALILKMVGDTCTARILVMTSHPWIRQH